MIHSNTALLSTPTVSYTYTKETGGTKYFTAEKRQSSGKGEGLM